MFIYKITNNVNGKVYIGQTSRSSIKAYWNSHISRLSRNIHHNKELMKDWELHGQSKFSFEVIESYKTGASVDLSDREIFWVSQYQSNHPNRGYNVTIGGKGMRGWVPSKETREKLSKSHVGKKGLLGKDNPMFGKTGEQNPFFGKKHSEEFLETKRRKIKGVNLSTMTEVIFKSIAEAAAYVNGQIGHVCSVCKGDRRTHKGWLFSYYEGGY